MDADPPFLFVVCQAGVEWALKADVARRHPEFRFAFSRPGFVTFKLPPGASAANLTLQSAFARTSGQVLGRLECGPTELAGEVTKLADGKQFAALHLWQRDSAIPGHKGFEPGPSEETSTIAAPLLESLRGGVLTDKAAANETVRAGTRVLDVVAVDEGRWFVGFHQADSIAARWPGGVPLLTPPTDQVSRAWLKMEEALAWSRFPLSADEPWLELGSAPGGSCQSLLGRGLPVTGIDPAAMDEQITANERFTHIKKRADDVRLREFAPFRWLAADINVAPTTTLDIVQRIVTHDRVHLCGLLLTLKLLDRDMYGQLDEYRQRVQSWGFELVRLRQLAFNRQEVCLAALRRKSMRREPKWKRN